MSSKKKQDVTSEKKKFSFFSFLRPKKTAEQTCNKTETPTAAVGIANATGTAPILFSKNVENPSSSNKGQIFSKYFSKGGGTDAQKKKKSKAVVQEEQKVLGTPLAIPITEKEAPSEEYKEIAPLSNDAQDVDYVETMRREAAATKIQAVFRGHEERQKYKGTRQNVIKIEALARGYLARKQVAEMKSALNSTEMEDVENTEKVSSENLIAFS